MLGAHKSREGTQWVASEPLRTANLMFSLMKTFSARRNYIRIAYSPHCDGSVGIVTSCGQDRLWFESAR
jgi:hypothetical protein